MEQQLYNMYLDGTLILKDATPSEILARAGTTKRTPVSAYADRGILIDRKYKVECSCLWEDEENIKEKKAMLFDWEQLTRPFKKVRWVTRVDRNTKVLRIKK